MDKSYRIHTNISSDTVLNVNMKQDFEFLEVLDIRERTHEHGERSQLDQRSYGLGPYAHNGAYIPIHQQRAFNHPSAAFHI